MHIRPSLLAVAAAPVIVLGASAGLAHAQDDSPPGGTAAASAPSPDGARSAFVCDNLDRIRQLRADRMAVVESRLALLQDARAAAEASGDAKAVERIDARIARVTAHQQRAAERGERLDTWAAEHC